MVASFLYKGTLLFAILAGLLSIKIKLNDMILANTINIIVSVVLGSLYITPPNSSWFNPFGGMNIAIIFTGIVILIVMLLVNFLSIKTLLKNKIFLQQMDALVEERLPTNFLVGFFLFLLLAGYFIIFIEFGLE